MSNKKYKLVEVSYEEHVALYEAGVWVQWDFTTVSGERWYESLDGILEDSSAVASSELPDQKYYTRIETEKSDEVQAS